MEFGWIDILVVITLILSVLFALYRGLVRELLGITSWILAGLGALYCYVFVEPLVHRFIENKTFAGIVAGAGISLVVLVVMTLINAKVTGRLRQSSLSGLDRMLGFLFGVFRAVLLIAVVYIAAGLFFSEKQLIKWEKGSYTMPYIRMTANFVRGLIPENFQNNLKDYEKGRLSEEKVQKIVRDIAEEQVVEKTEKAVKETTKEAVKNITNYQKSDRKSLDDMIEKMIEE